MKTAPVKERTAEKKVLVLGIGNVLMRDEGLGIRALEAVSDAACLLQGVECLDGGTTGLALLEHIKRFPSVIIIDAVQSGSKPGTVIRIQGKDIPKSVGLCSSPHGLGVKELMALAEFEGYRPDVTIIGMEPKDVSAGLDLTPLVKKRLSSLAGAVMEELHRLSVKAKERRGHA